MTDPNNIIFSLTTSVVMSTAELIKAEMADPTNIEEIKQLDAQIDEILNTKPKGTVMMALLVQLADLFHPDGSPHDIEQPAECAEMIVAGVLVMRQLLVAINRSEPVNPAG
jgi:hypothetical protein